MPGFGQLNTDKPDVHHDALEFADGQIVLIHDLRGGQRATVLQMPASPRAIDEMAKRAIAFQLNMPNVAHGKTLYIHRRACAFPRPLFLQQVHTEGAP